MVDTVVVVGDSEAAVAASEEVVVVVAVWLVATYEHQIGVAST